MRFVPAKNHGPAANFPIVRIVMHGTVSPCVPGGARAIARMFETTSRDASTQYVCDPTEAVQCVPDNVIAYGAPPNKGSIHVEQCDPQTGPVSRWQDANHQAMLRVAAKLVAGLCRKYNIPVVKLNAADLRAGRKGICGHADVSAAWHQTDHIDPGGGYPWGQLLHLVNAELHPPTPPAITGDKVLLLINDGQEHTFLTDGIQMRWIKHNADLAVVQYNMVHHFNSPNTTNYPVTPEQIPFFGVIVGDNPYVPA